MRYVNAIMNVVEQEHFCCKYGIDKDYQEPSIYQVFDTKIIPVH